MAAQGTTVPAMRGANTIQSQRALKLHKKCQAKCLLSLKVNYKFFTGKAGYNKLDKDRVVNRPPVPDTQKCVTGGRVAAQGTTVPAMCGANTIKSQKAPEVTIMSCLCLWSLK